MKRSFALIPLLVFACATNALAKQSPSLDKPHGKSAEQMPEQTPVVTPGYDAAKKVIAEDLLKQSAEKKLERSLENAREILSNLLQRLKPGPQKGDPKTLYRKEENRYHSRKQSRSVSRHLDLSVPYSEPNLTFYETTIQANYYYNPANPYDNVIVVYDANTKKPLSATGYKTAVLDTYPDVSGMTLVGSGVRSDGTLSYQSYQSPLDADGGYTRITIRYDESGVFSEAVKTIVEPLNLKKVRLPKLA